MGPVKYMKEVVKEGRRIRWPKREDLIKTAIVVIVITAFAALVLSLEDLAAGSMINQLRNAFGGK
ncbi:MAG: preprotein translocase subunit SecE [Bacilli bacterium]|nr:preprotein translocase subunit SecE [Bacilli bacterium]MBQ4255994.1 preprotein translocase subunit SecE [Bacilli bacterium]